MQFYYFCTLFIINANNWKKEYMNRLIFNTLAFVATFFIPIFGLAQEPLQLTLDQALEIALSRI